MRRFVVYFELFGRKMKTKVSASSVSEAEQIIKDKIVFHKFDDVTDDESISKLADSMKDIIDLLKQSDKK